MHCFILAKHLMQQTAAWITTVKADDIETGQLNSSTYDITLRQIHIQLTPRDLNATTA